MDPETGWLLVMMVFGRRHLANNADRICSPVTFLTSRLNDALQTNWVLTIMEFIRCVVAFSAASHLYMTICFFLQIFFTYCFYALGGWFLLSANSHRCYLHHIKVVLCNKCDNSNKCINN